MTEITQETQIILDMVNAGYESMSLTERDQSTLKTAVLSGMNRAQEREIKDLLAFIEWSSKNHKSQAWIASNLMHDLNGFAMPEPCFLPRTSGYSDLIEKGVRG